MGFYEKKSPFFHHGFYPLVICYIAIEHGPVEIVSFPIKHGGSFHSFLLTFTRPGITPPFSYGFSYDFPIKPPFFIGFPMIFP